MAAVPEAVYILPPGQSAVQALLVLTEQVMVVLAVAGGGGRIAIILTSSGATFSGYSATPTAFGGLQCNLRCGWYGI